MSARSSSSCSVASRPRTTSRSSPFAFATAFVTPLPPYASPPSRSSTASWTPVEAPDGMPARPTAPDSSTTSTSTVGLPRESRIWRACTRATLLIGQPPVGRSSAGLLREIEVAVLLVERQLAPGGSVRCRKLLGLLDARAEAVARRPEGELGIDVETARDVHGGEEHVSELLEHARVGLGLGRRLAAGRSDRLAQLAQLVVEIGERAADVRILEAHRLRALLHLACVENRRKGLRHVVEDLLAPFLLALDPVPARAHGARAIRLGITEHVRVAANELLMDSSGNFLQASLSLLRQEKG